MAKSLNILVGRDIPGKLFLDQDMLVSTTLDMLRCFSGKNIRYEASLTSSARIQNMEKIVCSMTQLLESKEKKKKNILKAILDDIILR